MERYVYRKLVELKGWEGELTYWSASDCLRSEKLEKPKRKGFLKRMLTFRKRGGSSKAESKDSEEEIFLGVAERSYLENGGTKEVLWVGGITTSVRPFLMWTTSPEGFEGRGHFLQRTAEESAKEDRNLSFARLGAE